MKNIFKVIFGLIFVVAITLICCILFISNDVPNFRETTLYNYINRNKDNIESVIVRTVTLLGENCYKLDVDTGYQMLNKISFKKKSNMTCTDSDMYLEFYFKDNKFRKLFFQCDNLIYNDEKYRLKDEIIVYNKDLFLPDKIDDNMIIISDSDKVECK